MILTCRIALQPTKEQESLFKQYADAARFVYNHSLDLKIKAYQEEGINLSWIDIRNYITKAKYIDKDLFWLKKVPVITISQAVRDMDKAFYNFFKIKGAGFPKFKKKNKATPSFYIRSYTLHSIDNKHIKIEGIKTQVKTYEKCWIPHRPINPRIKFDGRYWYLTYGVELIPENKSIPVIARKFYNYKEIRDKEPTEPLGIDLGILHTAVLSNGTVYENINKTNLELQRLQSKKKRLQQQLSKKYEMNKQGNKFIKTNNIKKLEHQLKLIDRRITNIRDNYIHNMTTEIVKTKPSKIVMEDLAVSNMMKNKYLSKAIQEQKFYNIRQQITYKSELYNIPIQEAPRFYPSSKTCSHCGRINQDLTLANRIFHCPSCGSVIDRDLNAAINLSRL